MIIYTDASYSNHKNMSGLGVVYVCDYDNNKIIEYGTYSRVCLNNNTAEIAAIALAIDNLKNKKSSLKLRQEEAIQIITDSQYAFNKIQHRCYGSNDFERYCLKTIYNFCENGGHKVFFYNCKGHCKDKSEMSYYNNRADKLSCYYRKLGYSIYYSNNPLLRTKNQHTR